MNSQPTNSKDYFEVKKPVLNVFLKISNIQKSVRLIFGMAKSIDIHLWIQISQTQHESLTYDMYEPIAFTI